MPSGYYQFCPVAMAAETLSKRWTLVLLRELLAGSTRFNELRRGLPRMSPGLLSARLKELEAAGIVRAHGAAGETGPREYILTAAGRGLAPVIAAVGIWGQRWVGTDPSLDNLDPALLMWDMRRSLDAAAFPAGRSVVNFIFPDRPASQRNWWLIVKPEDGVDLCHADPGFDVDLFVTAELRSITAVWLGLATVKGEIAAGRIVADGDRALASRMQGWLGLSHFAGEPKQAV